MTSTHHIFDRGTLVRRRDRAADRIDAHDFLLQRAADDICERLLSVRRTFPLALNLGAHSGVLSRRLRQLPGMDCVIDADLSMRLLARCSGPCVVADEEALPFRDGALDLVVSGLSLHHVNDLPGALVQIRRALKPDGLFLGALLGGRTLNELREVFLEAEMETAGGASPRVAPFADVRDLGALFQRAEFALPVADSDLITVAYPNAVELMRDIKAMGASNVLTQRRRSFLRRETLARAASLYAQRFSRADGRITATFEIVTLTGWAPHESQQKPLRPGSARARLADALGVEEQTAGDRIEVPGKKG